MELISPAPVPKPSAKQQPGFQSGKRCLSKSWHYFSGVALILIEKWQSRYSEQLSERAIRNHFAPSERYRISRYCYPPGSGFSGGMLAGTCFVLSGQCSIMFGNDCAHVVEKDVLEVPGGSYSLQVDGKEPAELIFVWEIPVAGQRPKNTHVDYSAAADETAALHQSRLAAADESTAKSSPLK